MEQWIEYTGAALAVGYLVLAVWQLRSCWYFYIASSVIYGAVFFDAQLYSSAALQLFFIGTGFFGLKEWGTDQEPLEVTTKPLAFHARAFLISCIGTLLAGMAAEQVAGLFATVPADLTLLYIDATISVFSVTASVLIARKIYEGWWYWLAIDLGAVIFYLHQDLFVTAGLYSLYVFLVVAALARWKAGQL